MTDEEALKEIDRQEERFAAAGFGNGLRLAKSAREYYQTIVKCRQKSEEVAAECAAANEKAAAIVGRRGCSTRRPTTAAMSGSEVTGAPGPGQSGTRNTVRRL